MTGAVAWPWSDFARVEAEQALYGSFPFRHRGYEVAAHSPGCRREWLDALARACANFGERPAGVAVEGALFALPVAGADVWMIVGVGEAGSDDRGRPGALAFHAWFVTDRDYRRVGAAPFGLAAHHRTCWNADPGALPAATLRVERFRRRPGPIDDPRALAVAHRLRHRRPVAFEAPGPIGGLARAAWGLLPLRVRRRASLATWAFGNANRFSLVAVPRRALVESDPAYVDPARLEERPAARWRDRLARRWPDALQSRT